MIALYLIPCVGNGTISLCIEALILLGAVLIIKKYSFSFLFLFLSACSSDSESNKSNYPSFSQTLNKSFHQKKKSSSVINQKIETSTNANGNANVDTSTDVGVATDVGADTSASIENLGSTSEGLQFATVQKVEMSVDVGSSAGMGAEASPITDTGAGINVVQETESKAIQKLVDFDVGGTTDMGVVMGVKVATDVEVAADVGVATDVGDHLIQKEECKGFSKADWINQDISIKQSIQDFTRKQMQNLLSINREFPSPQDKEDSVRCFVRTAFSLNNILRIATDHWWEGVQEVSFQTPHEETLMKFIEHYFLAWIGYGLLLQIKPVSSDRIDFVVEEPYLLGDTQYAVVTNFTIMNFYSAKIVWIVNVQSFPEGLSFLDISFEGVSSLYLLKNQMDYLFREKNGNMDEVAFRLQNKMDDSSFSNL